MAQWIWASAANPADLVLVLRSRQVKERKRSDSKLTSDLHTHAMACTSAHIHANSINKCNKHL